MSTIRLTKTGQLCKILEHLRATRYPLLDDTEIIKAIISQQYIAFQKEDLPIHFLSDEEEKNIRKAEKDIKQGKFTIVAANEPIDINMF